MRNMPSESVLTWAANAVGPSAKVVSVESLHGGTSPWLLHIEHDGSTRETVLRLVPGRLLPFQIRTGAAALRVAEEHGLSAPRLIASDLDGRATGGLATLETAVPGTSASPSSVSAERLRTIGAAVAKVHEVALDPEPDLPLKVRSLQAPIYDDDEALVRRWATLYRASPERERPAVVGALCELTGLAPDRSRQLLTGTHTTPLLQLADDILRELPTPKGKTVFVHADLWAGNMMWNDDTSVTLIDWKDAGVGDPGVDLGHLRMKMAVQYGPDAATHVLEGWQRESGHDAANLAYWDAVAALHTPADLDDWEHCFDEQGDRLSSRAATDRRDAFLRAALDELDRGGVTYEWLG